MSVVSVSGAPAANPHRHHFGNVVGTTLTAGLLNGIVTHLCFKGVMTPWMGGGMAAVAMALSFLAVPLINACGYNTAPNTCKAFGTVVVLTVSTVALTAFCFATFLSAPLSLPTVAASAGINLATLYLAADCEPRNASTS